MKLQIKSSRIENGLEICNICGREASKPFRYQNNMGQTRGCISQCHDTHIRVNTKPNWMAPRYVLPRWVTEARRTIKKETAR